jgi:diguanylate cyclase (GGDEF)-like protein
VTPVLLLVAPDVELRHTIEEALIDMPVEVSAVVTEEQARRALIEVHPTLAIVSDALPDNGSYSLSQAIRAVHHREPFQIILAVTKVFPGLLERAINGLIDDFYIKGSPLVELRLRVQAALRRLAEYHSVSGEREYYRRAARNEEELTSKVLDETIALREENRVLLESSSRDPDSGLLRFPALLEDLDVEVERAARSINVLSGFLTGPDGFDELRATHGPDAGRRLFAQLGRSLIRGVRKYDVCGHYGDAAVFVALPGTDIERARVVAERFLGLFAKFGTQSANVATSVTFSFGLSALQDGETRDHWLKRTETTLDRARELGGDRIESVDSLPDPYTVWKATRGR